MKILVLGGTGLISRAVVREGVKQGHEMTVFNRGHRTVDFGGPVETIIGDKTNPEELRGKTAGRRFDAVIDMISFDAADAKNTVEIFAKNADQLIFTSSIAAYNRPPRACPATEETETLTNDPAYSYGYYKAEMERYLYTVMEAGTVPVTIIRPSLTFGEGGANIGVLRQNYNIISRLRNHKPLILCGDGTAVWSFTYAGDLAKAYIGCVKNPKTYNQYYHAANDKMVLFEDLYNTFGELVGEKPILYHLPAEALFRANPDMFGHYYYEKKYPTLYDSSKIKAAVPSFVCETDLKALCARMLAWWEDGNGVVDAEKDAYEDKLCAVYEAMMAAMEKL